MRELDDLYAKFENVLWVRSGGQGCRESSVLIREVSFLQGLNDALLGQNEVS